MTRFHFVLTLILLLVGCESNPPSRTALKPRGVPPLIIISIDAFRPDYLHKGDTTTLDRLAKGGVFAQLRPSFPTLTFPNHYTLVTGLRPDHHGVIGNRMTDPVMRGELFDVSKNAGLNDPRWWRGGVPAWVTAQIHGLMTAAMFWPGSDVDIMNTHPGIWYHFDASRSPKSRIETALSWFDRPVGTRPALSFLYFDEVDRAGHRHGPFAPETKTSIRQVDAAIATLIAGLEQRHIAANIIIVSDHGMTTLSPERVILLTDLAPAGAMSVISSGPYAGINPVAGHEHELRRALEQPHDHVTCWPKNRIPERLHYGRHRRVPAWLCLAETGWSLKRDAHAPLSNGGHGYDNAAPDMLATFIASGPAFLPNKTLPTIDNVDVYPLIMLLLGLLPQNSDGSLDALQHGLHDPYRSAQ